MIIRLFELRHYYGHTVVLKNQCSEHCTFSAQPYYIHKKKYQVIALYNLFVGYFSDMFRSDLIDHLQGDFYNVCRVCFNLSEFSHMTKISALVDKLKQMLHTV